jgi:Ca-activated chloride channel homolog
MSFKTNDSYNNDSDSNLDRRRGGKMLVGVCFVLILATIEVRGQASPPSPVLPGATGIAQAVTVPDAAPASPSDGSTTPEQPDAQPSADDQGSIFVFKTEVHEVILHAIVVDDQRRLVINLDRPAFAVFEDGVPQPTTSFRRDDVPVALGIVIDNSGSMREKRDNVNQAVLNLIRASGPNDETFVVNFSQDSYLDQDFTSNVDLLQRALQKVSAQGSTALYDAIVAAAVHLKNDMRVERKVLLVITDGRDNASQETLQEAMRRLQQVNGPTLYAIGLLGDELQQPDIGALKSLADSTGGVAFFPKRLDEVDDITRTVARDIHSQYVIGYHPTNHSEDARYRVIEVRAHTTGRGKLSVRTRSGYYSGEVVR